MKKLILIVCITAMFGLSAYSQASVVNPAAVEVFGLVNGFQIEHIQVTNLGTNQTMTFSEFKKCEIRNSMGEGNFVVEFVMTNGERKKYYITLD